MSPTSWVFNQPISSLAKLVLLAVVILNGRDIPTGINTIADSTGLAPRTVRRFVKNLKAIGLVRVDGVELAACAPREMECA